MRVKKHGNGETSFVCKRLPKRYHVILLTVLENLGPFAIVMTVLLFVISVREETVRSSLCL